MSTSEGFGELFKNYKNEAPPKQLPIEAYHQYMAPPPKTTYDDVYLRLRSLELAQTFRARAKDEDATNFVEDADKIFRFITLGEVPEPSDLT
jgi:hypothetical protein